MKKTTAVYALLSFAVPLLSHAATPPAFCNPDSGLSSNTGRKIAIVVDSSGSNGSNDPQNLRIDAAKGLNDLLTSKAEAGPNGKPDLVTVIDFDSSASVIYPLGDPDGAVPTFDTIDSSGGTDVADGLKVAITELQKGGNTAKRSGIVILTDGESSTDPILEQLAQAKNLGIRVILGFLQPPPPATPGTPVPEIVEALEATGGMYAGINSPAAQKAFINAVVAHGPTEADSSSSGGNDLFPGLSKVATLKTGEATFTYTPLPNEKLNFTITSPKESLILTVTLRAGNNVLKEAKTSEKDGTVSILWTAPSASAPIELVAKSSAPSDDLVTVELSSNIPRTDICKPTSNTTHTNTTKPNTTTTKGPEHKYTPSPLPPTYTGAAAAAMTATRGSVVLVVVMMGLLAVFEFL